MRASRIVRFFVGQGLGAIRMKATGYAETRPKVPNADLQGNPIPENKEANRRVAIRIYPMSMAEQKAFNEELRLRDQRKEDMKAAGAEQTPQGIPPGTPATPAPKNVIEMAPASK